MYISSRLSAKYIYFKPPVSYICIFQAPCQLYLHISSPLSTVYAYFKSPVSYTCIFQVPCHLSAIYVYFKSEVSYATWLAFNIPLMLLNTFAAWVLLIVIEVKYFHLLTHLLDTYLLNHLLTHFLITYLLNHLLTHLLETYLLNHLLAHLLDTYSTLTYLTTYLLIC